MSENIGFTGTREKPTTIQSEWLTAKLVELFDEGATYFHHGDCFGADELAHEIATEIGYLTVVHPPINSKYRAYCLSNTCGWPAKGYILRNHDIVNISDTILALPKGPRPDSLRGQGTWSTIEYAIHLGKPTWICMPDGKIL